MKVRVVITDDGLRMLEETVEWWTTNRASTIPVFEAEFGDAIQLLHLFPDAGAMFRRSRLRGVRRLLLSRSLLHVYYLHDRARRVVFIIGARLAMRKYPPRLKSPNA
ncbi:MAG: hypothetical protein HY791_13695 [Deltaproteobacteria bacterium]|nr:hypothetical protein [Deltaproteobacteria bacterium]